MYFLLFVFNFVLKLINRMRPIPVLALLFAPLASVPVALVFSLMFPPAALPDVAFSVWISLSLALVGSYLGTVVVGLPAFLLMRRSGQLNAIRLCLIGIVVPLLATPVFVTVLWGSLAVMSALCGLAVAMTAWNLAPKGPAPTPSKPGSGPGGLAGGGPSFADAAGPACHGCAGSDCPGSP